VTQRLTEALRHGDWPGVAASLAALDVLVRPTDTGAVLEGFLPEALRGAVEAQAEPLIRTLREQASGVSPLGQTPLFQAWKLDERRARQLVLCGTDVRAQDRLGRTALHEAVTLQKPDVVRVLVEAGAPLAAADQGWRTPLHLAAENGREDIVGILMSAPEPPLQAQDAAGRTPLHLAAREARAGVVRQLIAAGAPVDAQDHGGDTPLLLGVQRGDEATVTALLEGGAAPAGRGAGPSPLRQAMIDGRTALICRLLVHGADPSGSEDDLLRTALEQRDHDLLAAVLAREPSALLADGTWLVEAVTRDDAMAVDMLLRAGAPAAAADNQPLKAAVYQGRALIARYLKAAGATVDPPEQIYEIALNEKPFRFQLDLVGERIVRSEVRRGDGWFDVEAETPLSTEPVSPQPVPEPEGT
jgi:ankyrin repeat protein